MNARLPDENDRLWGRALAEHQLGGAEASKVALDALITRGADSMAYDIAAVLAHRGETDQAFKWLERALAQREAGMFGGLRSDPFLRSLRDDPRFEVLLRKMKAPVAGTSR